MHGAEHEIYSYNFTTLSGESEAHLGTNFQNVVVRKNNQNIFHNTSKVCVPNAIKQNIIVLLGEYHSVSCFPKHDSKLTIATWSKVL